MPKKNKWEKNSIGYTRSLGNYIDILIKANITNWNLKECLYDNWGGNSISYKTIADSVYKSYRVNKIRNKVVTKINRVLQNGPSFHFRNYHNY